MGLEEFLNNEETSLVRVEEGQLIIAEQMRNKLIEFETQKKLIDQKEKEMKQQLKEIMKANGITGYESNDKRIKITLGDDSETETIDKDKLYLEYKPAYDACVKFTPREGSLRITIREVKDE